MRRNDPDMSASGLAADKPSHPSARTRTQAINRQKIQDAATRVFAQHGYRGATVEQIAIKAGMSKPNLLYYYPSKKALYLSVLQGILDTWLEPLRELDVDKDPAEEIGAYIDRKIEYARLYPMASKVFANEVIAGAPIIRSVLETQLRDIVGKKAKVLRTWARQGRIADVDPYHLIFVIWASTQTYADFSTQVEAVTGKTLEDERFYRGTKRAIKDILLRGVLPAGP